MSKVAKSALILVVFAIFSKGLGLVREMVLAGKNGTSMVNDVFFIMFYNPSFFYEGLSAAIINAYIPLFLELKKKGEQEVHRFNSNLITLFTLLSLGYIALIFLFPSFMTRILAWGYAGEAFQMAMGFARILSFTLLFFLISQVLQAFLQANERFVSTGLTGIPLNVFIILGILLSSEKRYYMLGVGALCAYASWLLMFAVDAARIHFRYKPRLDLQDPNMRRMFQLIVPVFLGTAVSQLNMIVDRSWASFLPEGSVSYLNFSQRLTSFIYAIFVFSVATAAFPKLSADSAACDHDGMKKTMVSSVNMISLLVIPICLLLIVLNRPVIQVLFQRGSFNPAATGPTALAMAFYAAGMVALGYREILVRMFYALQDIKTPMLNGLVTIAFNAGLNYLLMGWGAGGLALGTSLSMTLTTGILFFRLRQKIGLLGSRKMLQNFGKMMAGGAALSVTAFYLYPALAHLVGATSKGILLSLLLTGCVSMAVYLGILKILQVEEIQVLMELLHRRKKTTA